MYLFVTLILVLIVLFVTVKLKKYQDINQLPGPGSLELIKFFIFSKSTEDILIYLINLQEKYGKIVKIWVKPFRPLLLIADPKYFEHILTSKEHLHRTQIYEMFNTISTIGLVANKDLAEWKADRKLFNAIFSTKEIAENINFQNFTEKLKSKIDTNENAPLDIHGVVNRWAISVVIDYLTNDHLDENTTDKFISAVDIVLKLTVERSFSPLKFYDWSYKFTKDYDITTKSASYINKVARDIIQKQTETRKNRKGVRNDFMDTILSKNYNEQFKQDHLKTFIIAGYETVSSTVSFALFEIAKKPNIQNKILKEYLDIVGTDDSNITYFDIKSMKYTESVLKETMRMYTPAPMVQRTLKTPVTVEKFTIPSNIDLIFSISALHQLNFPNPNEFDPDRFSFENIKNINAYAYTPFSLGPRDCIGRRLAMIEMKYLLSYIVKNFTLHPVEPEHKLDLALDLGLKSKNGVPIIFKKRII